MKDAVNNTKCNFKEIINETEKAYLVDFGDVQHWIPKAQITEFGESENTIEIPDWLYKKLEL